LLSNGPWSKEEEIKRWPAPLSTLSLQTLTGEIPEILGGFSLVGKKKNYLPEIPAGTAPEQGRKGWQIQDRDESSVQDINLSNIQVVREGS